MGQRVQTGDGAMRLIVIIVILSRRALDRNANSLCVSVFAVGALPTSAINWLRLVVLAARRPPEAARSQEGKLVVSLARNPEWFRRRRRRQRR